MKVVYPIYRGVDVHKTFWVGAITSTPDGNSLTTKRDSFLDNSNLHRFVDRLHTNTGLHVCMKPTGKYWVPVLNILEKRGACVTIANPKWIQTVKGNKDDTENSKWTCDLFRLCLVPSSFISLKNICILRKFTR